MKDRKKRKKYRKNIFCMLLILLMMNMVGCGKDMDLVVSSTFTWERQAGEPVQLVLLEAEEDPQLQLQEGADGRVLVVGVEGEAGDEVDDVEDEVQEDEAHAVLLAEGLLVRQGVDGQEVLEQVQEKLPEGEQAALLELEQGEGPVLLLLVVGDEDVLEHLLGRLELRLVDND